MTLACLRWVDKDLASSVFKHRCRCIRTSASTYALILRAYSQDLLLNPFLKIEAQGNEFLSSHFLISLSERISHIEQSYWIPFLHIPSPGPPPLPGLAHHQTDSFPQSHKTCLKLDLLVALCSRCPPSFVFDLSFLISSSQSFPFCLAHHKHNPLPKKL